MIEFEKPAQHAEFKDFKQKNQIGCWLWSDEWNENNKNVVVVDRKYQKQAFEFINYHRS